MNPMKRFTILFTALTPLWCILGFTVGVLLFEGCKTGSTTAYTTINAVETAVNSANMAFLDSVVLGQTPTNSVPTVEAAYNDTQLALRAAAAIASGGSGAAVPATVMAKATSFTNTINAAKGK